MKKHIGIRTTHLSDVRLKLWEKGKLDRNDWDFSACFDDEIEDCFCYEYARESREAMVHVHLARQQARGQNFDDLNRLNWQDRPAYQGDKTPPSLPVGFFATCPEWPDKPYLSIPRFRRKQRRVTYWANAIEHEEIVTNICKLFHFSMGDDYCERGGIIQSIEGGWWYVALGIDWRRSNENLLQAFAAWLKENRPSNMTPVKKANVGAGSKLRQMRADLKALGAFRLLREHGVCHKAYAAIYDATHGKFLPQHESAWSRAKRRAQIVIHQPYDRAWFLGNLNRPFS